jgi:hypothetical protein
MYKDMNNKNENIKSSENQQDIEPSISERTPSQLELIKQWRTALTCLVKDVELNTRSLHQNAQLTSVRESMAYLEIKNTLLDEDDDFQLSESGFSKYKAKHQEVFSYLSLLSKHAIQKIKPEFYFVDINKHFEQQLIPIKWTHFLMHLLIIPMVCIAFLGIGSILIKQTQNNMVVNILLFLCVVSQFNVIPELFKKVKKTVASPFKYKVGLLAIHLTSALKKLFWICLIPFFLVKRIQPYWMDDVIIISLFIYYIVICSIDQFIELDTLNDSSKKEAENV